MAMNTDICANFLSGLGISFDDVSNVSQQTNDDRTFKGKNAELFYKIYMALQKMDKNYLLFFGTINILNPNNNFIFLRNIIKSCCPNADNSPDINLILINKLREEADILDNYLSSLPSVMLNPIDGINMSDLSVQSEDFNSHVKKFVQAFICVFGNHPEMFNL